MSDKVIAMHEKVVKVLQESNKELELEIIQADDVINYLEEEIND